jgi:hypothetical protein
LYDRIIILFQVFFIAALFVRSISIVEPVWPAPAAMHFCLDMCFFKRNAPAFFFCPHAYPHEKAVPSPSRG